MEFVLLGLLLLAFPIIAIVALVKTVNINDRLRGIERRLMAIEPQAAGAAGRAPAPPSRQTVARPVPRTCPERRPRPRPEPRHPRRLEPAPAAASAALPAGSAGAHDRLRGKFGTRWTVWIGGVALALGGIFLVKYSIEAGLIGPGPAAVLRRAAGGGPGRRRRMDAPAGAAHRLCRPARRPHPEHPDRRRHHRRLCHGLCGLRALRLPQSGLRLRAARRGRAGDARRGAAARTGAGRARPRRRLRHAAAGRLRGAELLGALHLSRRW